jgi:hypothetical protein
LKERATVHAKLLKTLLVAALASSLTGCYRVTYDMDPMASPALVKAGQRVRSFRTELKSTHLAWGLVNPNDRIVMDAVAREVKLAGGKRARNVRLTREVGVVDGLVGMLTVGLYTPWTLVIEGEVVR